MKVPDRVVWMMIVIIAAAILSSHTKNTGGEADGKPFAVLELFTSEGCSSCPPADELLAKIQRETEGKSIYLLAYHVDYWNRLGWKDPYSSADFSDRQNQYGQWLGVSPIYTPQLIVNGKTQFVGSDESAVRHAISEQMASNPAETLTMEVSKEGEQLKIKYQVTRAVKNSRILIALIQKTAQTKVERGENAGRLLSHVQIVRKLQTEQLKATGDGEIVIVLPKEFNLQNGELVGLIQDQSNGEILAAARTRINNQQP